MSIGAAQVPGPRDRVEQVEGERADGQRRTREIGLFPNENSVLRLVTAILMEESEEWETGKSYLSLTPQNRITNTQNKQQTAA